MRSRYWVLLCVFALACGGLVYVAGFSQDQDNGITLAELDAVASPGVWDRSEFSMGVAAATGSMLMNELDLQAIFYGVLGICALVLALRVVLAVLQSIHERRAWSRERAASSNRRASLQATEEPRSVVVPMLAHQTIDAEIVAGTAGRASESPDSAMRLRDLMPRSIRGPVARMIFLFAGIVAVFGVLSAALVYLRLSVSLKDQALLLARVTAANVSDGAATLVLKRNDAALRELLRKQASKSNLAYLVVEDRSHAILAHSFPVLPEEIGNAALGPIPTKDLRLLRIGNNEVYEVAAPILEGRSGYVRAGIWRERVDAEIRKTTMPLMGVLLALTLGGSLLAMYLAWWINRPIFRLVAAAKAISSGDLDVPTPNVGDSGEFGELSRAIERLRSSVKAAMVRLSR